MLPPLTDVIFTGHLKTHFGEPSQIQLMIDIYYLKDNMVDNNSSS